MSVTNVNPYSKLAAIYDGMMEQVDYHLWAHYIDSLLKSFGHDVKEVCELACGTGSLAIELSKYGYQLTCSDQSADMIDCASAKVSKKNRNISFFISDMCNFKSDRNFDAVICIYDSINYLMDEISLKSFFMNAHRLLKKNAIMIFDACTEINSLENFDKRYENDRHHHYVRRSRYLKNDRIQENEIEITRGNKKYIEVHRQKIYPLEVFKRILQTLPFEILAQYSNFSYDPGTESSERVHFVLKAK
ncbi:class I SAM-dependent methyltransferase [bacterium]|nr:class I SAM-dependent methyltransferase [bacterium]